MTWLQQHTYIWRVGSPAKLLSRVKWSERRRFIFIFRFNIVLHDSDQTDETVTGIEEWKEKFQATKSKPLVEFNLDVLEASVVS